MNTNLTETPSVFRCAFTVGGEKGRYQVSFLIENNRLKASCNCGHKHPCWHIQYILAGKTSRIIGGDTEQQGVLIQQAEITSEGLHLIRKARKKFAGETHCRRCSSERIVKIRTSLSARLLTLFKDTATHTHFCKDCKWTW